MNLIRLMKKFCSDTYGTPGGFEDVFYSDLIHKISRGTFTFQEKFMISAKCEASCRHCPNQYTFTKHFPVVTIPSDQCFGTGSHSMADLITNPFHWHAPSVSVCSQTFNGGVCGSPLRWYRFQKITHLPDLFVVNLREEYLGYEELNLKPENEITIECEGETIRYRCIAFSSVFSTFDNQFGVDLGHRYVPPKPEYTENGVHTVIHLLTHSGFIEINNGQWYGPIEYLLNNYTSGASIFYQRSSFEWLPELPMYQ